MSFEKEELESVIKKAILTTTTLKTQCDELLDPNSQDQIEKDSISNLDQAIALINMINNDFENRDIPKSSSFIRSISSLLSQIEKQLSFNSDQEKSDYTKKERLIRILTNTGPKLDMNKIKEKTSFYNFYKSIEFAKANTVVVGANGSGKTTLASFLTKGGVLNEGVIIPSQKLLLIPTIENIPRYVTARKELDRHQKTQSNYSRTYSSYTPSEAPQEVTQNYISEFNFILRTLFSEQAENHFAFCNNLKFNYKEDKRKLSSTLDQAIMTWNTLFDHKNLFCKDACNLSVTSKGESEDYPVNEMSDGEKAIFYLIAKVLLAPKNSLIVIDEPELYLHKAIVDKLWNILEVERKDCVFIYLTHDLDFAASRNAKKFWIKSFTYPGDWDIEPIPENEIPESLLMGILGSRKKILFCEGVAGGKSLDLPILEALFPNYTIRPVVSCREVINYTKAFNNIPNKNGAALGIIDRDFRDETELEKLKKGKVYTFEAAEIENLLLVEEFIEAFATYKNEDIDINSLKKNVLIKFSSDKDTQVIQYITRQVNQRLKGNPIQRKKTKEEIISSLNQITIDIDIDCMYNKRVGEIEEIIKNDAYDRAILVYNNKGLHTIIEQSFGYEKNIYHQKALEFLQKSDEAKEILRRRFPNELVSE